MSRKKIAGIVPCAGLSRRMGAFKPLLPFGDGTMIRGTVLSLLNAGVKKLKRNYPVLTGLNLCLTRILNTEI